MLEPLLLRRKRPESPRSEVALERVDGSWMKRSSGYCQGVQHPLKSIGGRTADGIFYLQPEIALLYKAARLRQVDDQDFRRVLPHLVSKQRAQLTEDIVRFAGCMV